MVLNFVLELLAYIMCSYEYDIFLVWRDCMLCRKRSVHYELARCALFALGATAVALLRTSIQTVGLLLSLWYVASAVAIVYSYISTDRVSPKDLTKIHANT